MKPSGIRREVWSADVTLSLDDAADLIATQFPLLAPARLVPLGTGFDNWAFRVNDAFVFRFPRRKIAERFLTVETDVLPHIAPQLPLPVPGPSHRGVPAGDYPYPFAGYSLLAGRTACGARLSDDERTRSAAALGRFLRALHGMATAGRDALRLAAI